MFSTGINDDIKSKNEVLSIIDSNDFKKIFTSRHINNVIVFGSLYDGDFNEESDVDIAVICDESLKLNPMEELKITGYCEELFGRNVDIIDINDENINNVIKISALNSRMVILKNNLLEKTVEKFDSLYKENREFWDMLDREVLYSE